jgi:hypothetical protein
MEKNVEDQKTKAGEQKEGKMSYEQLELIAHQLSTQNKELHTQLKEVESQSFFMRLEFLFKVLDHRTAFSTVQIGNSFVEKCAKEIQFLMTIPEKPSKNCRDSDINKN